jgi:hypothetical protein
MGDKEYARLQAVFLAMANQSDHPPVKARWLALAQACKDSLTGATRSRSNPDPAFFVARWQRAA